MRMFHILRSSRTRLSAAITTFLCALAVGAVALPALAAAHTVVSIEFDDGDVEQFGVLPMLESHGMHATFFVNSGVIGLDSGNMTWQQVTELQAAGNEIGSHTVTHANLPTLEVGEMEREVCNDRVTLANHGITQTDFAYPYGAVDATAEEVVRGCGDNSGRGVGGVDSPGCTECLFAEPIPPVNAYDTANPESIEETTTLATMESYVTEAEEHGGGWVQIVFHHICEACGQQYSTTASNFNALLSWLQPRSAQGTVVETVHEVIGGSVQPPHSGPLPPPPSNESNLVANPSFEESGLLSANTVRCYDLAQFGSSTVATTRTSTAHSGAHGLKLTVSNYVSGDAKILTQQDLGECAPYLKVGQRYKISGWYQSTAPTLFIIYGRNPQGGWEYLTESQLYSASSSWTQATYVTPPLPAGYSGISFGLGLVSNGTLTVDDYGMAAQPSVAAGENMLQNTSLEEATDPEGIPNCWGTGSGGGTNTATWSRTHEAHSGEWAEQVEISSYTSGDEKLVSRQDTGSCAPTAKPGHTYNASAWYESNQPVHLVAYDYIPEGTEKGWHFWAQSNPFAASSTYTQAKWTTPAFPADATLISIGASSTRGREDDGRRLLALRLRHDSAEREGDLARKRCHGLRHDPHRRRSDVDRRGGHPGRMPRRWSRDRRVVHGAI